MALAMMRMIKPPGRIEGGQVIVDGTDLITFPIKHMLKARLEQNCLHPSRRNELSKSCNQNWRADDGCDQGSSG